MIGQKLSLSLLAIAAVQGTTYGGTQPSTTYTTTTSTSTYTGSKGSSGSKGSKGSSGSKGSKGSSGSKGSKGSKSGYHTTSYKASGSKGSKGSKVSQVTTYTATGGGGTTTTYVPPGGGGDGGATNYGPGDGWRVDQNSGGLSTVANPQGTTAETSYMSGASVRLNLAAAVALLTASIAYLL